MRFLNKRETKSLPLLGLALILALVFAVACGSAAVSEEPAPDTSVAPPVVAPVAEAAPTAVPQAMTEPGEAESEAHPGNVTWMMAAWGDEQFDKVYSEGASNSYGRIFQAFLLEATEKTELVPGMASDWGYSPDGLTWSATIRDGIKFHDGSDMTMEDVVWSLEHNFGSHAFNYTYSGTVSTFSKKIVKVEQTGPREVSVVFAEIDTGFPGYLSAAGPSWGTFVPARPAVDGQEFPTVDAAQEAAYQENPIAPGPMKILRLVPSEVINFERFGDYYYQPKNGLDEDRRVDFATLDLRLVPEEATRVAALRAGEVDVAPVSVQARNQVEKGGGRIVWAGEGGYFRIMLMGCWSGGERAGFPAMPCEDKRVRHALDYALNRAEIQALFGGSEALEVEQGGWNVITPSTIGYSPDLNPPPFDPAKARQLLHEAGYKTPEHPDGKDFGKLVINTWVSALMVFLPESAQLAAESWRKELGIDTEVVVGEEVAMKRAYKTRATDGQIIWRDNETRLDAASIIGAGYGNLEYKAKFHNTPELANFTKEAISVFDDAERPAALNNLYRRLYDEKYQLSVGTINIPWALGPDVANWEPFPVAFYPSGLHTLTLK